MKNKKLRSNLITYGIVIAAYILVQILSATGNLSSMLKGLLVPLCVYVVLAVSLNLVVGISGELSLGHAGFMCVGAFSSAFFSKCVQDVVTVPALRLTIAMLIGAAVAAVFGILIGIPVLRLKGDSHQEHQACTESTSKIHASFCYLAKIRILFHFTIPAVPAGIFFQRLPELGFAEIGPQGVGKIVLGICALPEQIIGEP